MGAALVVRRGPRGDRPSQKRNGRTRLRPARAELDAEVSEPDDADKEHSTATDSPHERGPEREQVPSIPSATEDASAYQWMWIFALFDLPVTTEANKRAYVRFRKYLLSQGFSMLQFSVYARHCPTEESGEGIRRRVGQAVPPRGQVRLLLVTDRQFGKMEIYVGKKRQKVEEPPQQFMLF